ncbi:MAG: O-antigen ligase family protein, partial [Desulfobacterales bacterium]|nr:O-antigen ligase family protein [Desulfobacterales bacterium]
MLVKTLSLSNMSICALNQRLLILLGFLIPITTAGTNVLLGFILLFWLVENVANRFSNVVEFSKNNLVSIMGIVITILYFVGLLYTIAGKDKIIEHLSDSVKFLFIPMVGIYALDGKISKKLLFSFSSAMGLTLFLSYLSWLNLVPDVFPGNGSRIGNDFVIFHDHIKQNIFMSYFFFITAVWGFYEEKKVRKIVLWGISLLAFFNILYLVQGKTGQVIAIVLLLYFLSMFGSKKQIVSILVLFGVLWGLMISTSDTRFNRIVIAANEIKAWEYGQPASTNSSSGLRLEWYINTAKLIIENPIFGTGTG